MKRLSPSLRVIRLLVATVVFLGLVAGFAGSLPSVWAGIFAEPQLIPSLMRAVAGVGGFFLVFWLVVSLLAGRIYCSTVCPLGILQDIIWWVRGRAGIRRLKPAKAHNFLRYGILSVVVLGAICGVWTGVALLDPYSLFGRVAAGVVRPIGLWMAGIGGRLADGGGLGQIPGFGLSSVVAGIFLVGLSGAVAWKGRIFCNTICPVGSFLGLLARRSVFRLKIDPAKCQKCGNCLRVCRAQCLDLKAQKIDFSRCVVCLDCVSICDEGAIQYERGDEKSAAAETPPSDPVLRKTLVRLATAAVSIAAVPHVLARPEGKGAGGGGKGEGHGGGSRELAPILPPGAVEMDRFLDRCTACGLCVANCPTMVLQPALLELGWRGLFQPILDAEAGYCAYDCMRCMEVCPTAALTPMGLPLKQRTRIGKAEFHKRHCVVFAEETECMACAAACPTGAIKGRRFRGHLELPEMDEDLCIGCGACEFVCPARPIRAMRVNGERQHSELPAIL